MVMFLAEKTAASTADRVPLQSFYRELYGGSADARPTAARSRLKALVPPRVKQWMAKYVPGVSRARRPWGLPPLGRIR